MSVKCHYAVELPHNWHVEINTVSPKCAAATPPISNVPIRLV